MGRTRAVVLGGKDFNVPKQLHRYFELVKHFHQDKSSRITGMPDCDIILVIRDYIHHSAIEQAAALAPGVPIVAARAGWSHMYAELERRKLLPTPQDMAVPEEMLTETPTAQETLEPPVPPEEQISDEELELLTAPPPPSKPSIQEIRLLEPQEDDRIETLAELFRATNGELTTEIRDLYVQKYKEAIPGPIAAAARRMAGIAPRPRNSVERIARNPVIQEALIQYANVDKLVEQRNEVLAEIEDGKKKLAEIEKELEVYKPMIAILESLRSAQQKVKQTLEQKAITQRKMTV